MFDDCQDIVKAVTADAAFKARYRIGAVNSINWARVAAQVVYYFKGYFAATQRDGEPVDFAVPSGNFGNILAGHVAREMGLPIRRLILATNENDVLDEFFRTGRYRPRRAARRTRRQSRRWTSRRRRTSSATCSTSSAAIPRVVRELWARIERDGGFDLAGTPHWERVRGVRLRLGRAARTPTASRRSATSHARYGVVDRSAHRRRRQGRARAARAGVPLVCLETALPAKFAATIREALGREPDAAGRVRGPRSAAAARARRCPPTPRASRPSSRRTPTA